jgi:GcrA cell cycle regulator
MTWTTERIELLKTHFDAGLSCEQIARRIGVSRNAVIGKLNRLGMSRLKSVIVRRAIQRERKATARLRGPRSVQHKVLTTLRTEPSVPIEEALIPSDQRCSLLDLTEIKCRWPIGEPGSASFCFCGNEQAMGMPYCAVHARMAYRPAAKRTARALPWSEEGRPRPYGRAAVGAGGDSTRTAFAARRPDYL